MSGGQGRSEWGRGERERENPWVGSREKRGQEGERGRKEREVAAEDCWLRFPGLRVQVG